MKKGNLLPAYKLLVQMRDFASKLDDCIKKGELEKASQIKIKILELQRGLKKIT